MLEDRYAHLHDRTEEGVTEVVEFRANIVKDKALREKMEAVRPSLPTYVRHGARKELE